MIIEKDKVLYMLSILGRGRIIMLLSLLFVNLLCAAMLFGYFIPAVVKSNADAASLKMNIRSISTSISGLIDETNGILSKKDVFEDLEKSGFFLNQDRKKAEDALLFARFKSGVISAKASIGQGGLIRDKVALESGRVILESNIKISVEALDDAAVYQYIDFIKKVLPGSVMLKNLSMERVSPINADVLRSIREGENPVLVKADIEVVWHTMVKDEGEKAGLSR